MTQKQKLSGFTLIELLVVIAIIGLLASIVMVSLGNARVKARDTKRIADLKEIQTAIEMYINDTGAVPINRQPGYGYGDNQPNFLAELIPNYIPTTPHDPQSPASTYWYYDYGASTGYCGYFVVAHLENPSAYSIPDYSAGNCGAASGQCNPTYGSYCVRGNP